MRLGALLHELSTHRRGLAVSALVALAVALISVFRVGLFPPSLDARGLEIGTASTNVLVDTPHSKLVDLTAQTNDFTALTARTDLLGNVMASYAVRTYIGRELGVSAQQIQTTAPITASVPRALVEPGSGQGATDILATAEHYKLQIQADPTVPILHLYTQAPTAAAAVRMANASVRGLQTYLDALAARQAVPPKKQVRLLQFGGAHGGTINSGVGFTIAVLAFLVVFVLGCGVVLLVDRVRRGWTSSTVAARTDA